MGTSSSSPKTNENGHSEDVDGALAALVARLVEEVRQTRGSNDDGGEVILDVTTNGVRCVILRPEVSERAEAAPHLSPREREIARMVALGYPNKTIAAVLDISTWTVGSHLRRIFAKLGVPSRAAMVARLAGDRDYRHETLAGEVDS